VILYTWRAGSFSSDVLRSHSSPHRLGRARERARVSEPARPRRFAPRWLPCAWPSGLAARVAGVVARRRFTLPPATSGQRRASATHPTRLVTRTEESWPFASRRGPITNPGGVAKARERVGGHRIWRGVPAKSSAGRGSLLLVASEPCPILLARRVLVTFRRPPRVSLSSP